MSAADITAEQFYVLQLQDAWATCLAATATDAVGGLYTDDSALVVDGARTDKLAGIFAAIKSFHDRGPTAITWSTMDALAGPSRATVSLVTGRLGSAMSPFVMVFYALPSSSGVGSYVRAQVMRYLTDAPAETGATADIKPVLEAVIDKYYATCSSGRRVDNLYLYRESSEVTIESLTGKGLAQVGEVLSGIPDGGYGCVTRDVVPLFTGVTLVLVTGKVALTGGLATTRFSHVFYLCTDASGPYISNEIFRFMA